MDLLSIRNKSMTMTQVINHVTDGSLGGNSKRFSYNGLKCKIYLFKPLISSYWEEILEHILWFNELA